MDNFFKSLSVEVLLRTMRPVRGLSIGKRAAECFVHTLNFVETCSYPPRLADVAEKMNTPHQSAIVRMEKDLKRANLIEGSSRKTIRFSNHVVLGREAAFFFLAIANY